MSITKEIAYRYLKDRKTMSRYTKDFKVVDIFTEPVVPGVLEFQNENTIFRCEYKDGDSLSYKNVHIKDLSKVREWVEINRQSLLNEILK